MFEVFISHYAGEKKIAEEFQTLLKEAFPGMEVFRSSDADSITTGTGQYSAILGALESSKVVIVLLSSESALRPWVGFETGFGIAKKLTVFPLAVRGAKPSTLPSPFSEMMVRSVTKGEVEKILGAVAEATGRAHIGVDVEAFVGAVDRAGAAIPDMKLELRPYLTNQGAQLQFKLCYQGHATLSLQAVVVGIPDEIRDKAWSPLAVPGHLGIKRQQIDGVPYIIKEQFANSSPPSARDGGGPNFEVLRPKLYSNTEAQLYELRFAIRRELDVFSGKHIIRSWIETDNFRVPGEHPMSSLKPN